MNGRGGRERVAVVGCGSIGSRYARLLAARGLSPVLFDIAAERAETLGRALGLPTAATLGEALAGSPAFALIATPPEHHAEPARAALEAGIPTLVEKPLAHTRSAAQEIVAAASASGTLARGVSNMRFHAGPMLLARHLDGIGRVLSARAHFGHRLSQMRPAGRDVFAAGALSGGVILDCIHEFDMAPALLGPLTLFASETSSHGPDGIEAEDFARVSLRTAAGVPVLLDLDFYARHKRRGMEIVGEEGTLLWASEGRAPERCRVVRLAREEEIVLLDAPVSPDEEYERMLDAFVGAVRAEGAPEKGMPQLQSLEEGEAALHLALAAREAGLAGRCR